MSGEQRSTHAAPGRLFRVLTAALVLLAAAVAGLLALNRAWPSPFSEAELAELASLSLPVEPLRPAPDPTNRFADDPRAAKLGARLFRELRFSPSNDVACSTCHQPERAFTDGLRVARGAGEGRRNTPSIVAAMHGSFYFWDGRRDSAWSQALVPLEGAAEHAGSRTLVAQVIARHHASEYGAIFGSIPRSGEILTLPSELSPAAAPAPRAAWFALDADLRERIERVFVNVGKALAAYERTLRFTPSRFDRYVRELSRGNRYFASRILNQEEIAGARWFIGQGKCTLCHRGPLLTSHEFFTLGLPFGAAGPDRGRAGAFDEVLRDTFNCRGKYSDRRGECEELQFMSRDKLGFLANFKTPSLRNATLTAPYMHAGQFERLEQVVAHYDAAPEVLFPEHTDIQPRRFSARQRAELVAFLGTLTSSIDDPLGRLR